MTWTLPLSGLDWHSETKGLRVPHSSSWGNEPTSIQHWILNTEIKLTLVSPSRLLTAGGGLADRTESVFFSFQGTIVLPNIASSLYDPEQWETPRQFNPGHFLDKDGNFVSQEAFLPFSIGKWPTAQTLTVWIGTVELRCPLKTYWLFILNFFAENSNISQSNCKHLFCWTNNNMENQRHPGKCIHLTCPIFGRMFSANNYGYWFGAYISTPDIYLKSTCEQLCWFFMHTKLDHNIFIPGRASLCSSFTWLNEFL